MPAERPAHVQGAGIDQGAGIGEFGSVTAAHVFAKKRRLTRCVLLPPR